MEQCLELIFKKKHYLQKLKEEIQELDWLLDEQKKQKREYETQNALLYVKLNQYQMRDEENSITTYLTLISLVLLIISILGLYAFIQMGMPFIQTFIEFLFFDILQVGCFLGSSKLVKQHFKKKREQKIDEIQAVSRDLEELREKRLSTDKEYSALYQKKQELLKIVSKEEADIQNISLKVVDALLSLGEEKQISLESIDALIAKKMEEGKQVLIDTNMKRILNHLENK